MPNVDLLRKTLAHIEANLGRWAQYDWRTETECGTAYCFAGWAVKLTGGKFYRDPDTGRVVRELVVAPGSAKPHVISDYAADLLGIEEVEDENGDYEVPLFDSYNTLDDLRRIVGNLCESEVSDR